MKKNYEAPKILFEDFSLSTSIAGTCGKIASFGEGLCGYKPDRPPVGNEGAIVFTSAVEMCTYKEDDGEYKGVCYHNPSDLSVLFSS